MVVTQMKNMAFTAAGRKHCSAKHGPEPGAVRFMFAMARVFQMDEHDEAQH